MNRTDLYTALGAVQHLIKANPEVLTPDEVLTLGMFFGEVSNLLSYPQGTCAVRECSKQASMILIVHRRELGMVGVHLCEHHYHLDQGKDDA